MNERKLEELGAGSPQPGVPLNGFLLLSGLSPPPPPLTTGHERKIWSLYWAPSGEAGLHPSLLILSFNLQLREAKSLRNSCWELQWSLTDKLRKAGPPCTSGPAKMKPTSSFQSSKFALFPSYYYFTFFCNIPSDVTTGKDLILSLLQEKRNTIASLSQSSTLFPSPVLLISCSQLARMQKWSNFFPLVIYCLSDDNQKYYEEEEKEWFTANTSEKYPAERDP